MEIPLTVDFIGGKPKRQGNRANACNSFQFFVVLCFPHYRELHHNFKVINWSILYGNFMVSLDSLPKKGIAL